MANEPSHPLTPAEAKARLRLAAQRASPVTLIQRYPWQASGLALIGGFVIGRTHLQSVIFHRRITPLLWRLVGGALLASTGKASCRSPHTD